MRKTFKLRGIDCANCALKLENELKRIDGVQDAKINFLLEKLVLEASDEDFDEIVERVEQAAKKAEPDCEFVR